MAISTLLSTLSCICDVFNAGFIPYNQLTQSAQGQDMSFLIGQTLKVKVVSVSENVYATAALMR